MKNHVFLDTGIFVALLIQTDRWHKEAKALFITEENRLCSSLLVYSEAYSWFLHRLGEEPARQFAQFFQTLPKVELFEASLEHHKMVQSTLNRFRGTKLTYVDASSLTFLMQKKIQTVWSTDHHLGLSGATVLPGS